MIRVRFFVAIFLLNWMTAAWADPADDLLEAARSGQTSVVLQLITKGTDVNAKRKAYGGIGSTALIEASKHGHLDTVRVLLAKGAEVNGLDDMGRTALDYASLGDHLDVVQTLLAKGADVNARDDLNGWGRNALSFASEYGNANVVKVLLAKGADINAKYKHGDTPLIYASLEGFLGNSSGDGYQLSRGYVDYQNVAQMLINKGADVNDRGQLGTTALMNAAQKADVGMVNLLIAKGAEVNAKDNSGETALKKCWKETYRYYEYPAVMEALITAGAEVNINDRHVRDLFFLAIEKDHIDLVRLLLDKGIDVNWDGNGKNAPLIVAARSGSLHVVKELLDRNANVGVKDQYGETALMIASANGNTEMVQALLAKKADVSAKAADNTTALNQAFQNNHMDVVKLLIANGAQVDARGYGGRTALMDASQNGTLGTVRMLLNSGADVNLKAYDGSTALMFAIAQNHLDVAQILLGKGADVNARNNDGKSAIDLLAQGNSEARKLLIKAGAVTATKNPDWSGVWKGSLGKQEITACFQLDNDGYYKTGIYYYSKYRQPITLDLNKDIIQAESSLILKETNGAWNLNMTNSDNVSGSWSLKDKKYPIALVRVPLANKDDEPCASSEFNQGRKTQLRLVATIGKINGMQYRIVTDKDEKDISSFELIGTDDITRGINDQLHKDLLGEINAGFDCTNSVLGRFGEKGDYASTRKPVLLTRNWLVAETQLDFYCGGNHPNTDIQYQIWNLKTGKLENIWTWFNASGASLDKTTGFYTPGSKLSKVLASKWPKSADSGADQECDDAEGMASWVIYPDNSGFVFFPQLPHVIQACADEIVIPYSELMPMLNAHGKAAVASFGKISTDRSSLK